MSGDYSASDIITYIGVPLAVLGVAPILYNTVTTLATLSKVRRLLRKSRLVGITRGDVINHVIECELARFSIAPPDRQVDATEYWNVYEHPSLVPGGSWTIFNWKMHVVGIKTQRIEYADQLRQPQAEINFEDLISYLLDLGAVPNPAGFQMLRTSGLWVPIGTPLLLSPDGHEPLLTIAPLDDSDGMLSLAIRWSRQWRMRGNNSLPPYWIQVKTTLEKAQTFQEGMVNISEDGLSATTKTLTDQEDKEHPPARSEGPIFGDSNDLGIVSSASQTFPSPVVIRCHISASGIASAKIGDDLAFRPLSITHLRPFPSELPTTAGIYVSCICTALSTTNKTVLWSYHIPSTLLAFSRSQIIPCGILVLLDMISISSTPEWYTKYDDAAEEMELQTKRMRESLAATHRENAMPPDQRAIAARERHSKQHQDFVDGINHKRRLATQRAETRMLEALQSPQWKAQLVGEYALLWLKEHNYVASKSELSDVIEMVLSRMLTEPSFAKDLAETLDAWKGWVEGGGIRKADYLMLKEKLVVFAFASLVLAMICESVEVADGSLSRDLQESVKIWKNVRLG